MPFKLKQKIKSTNRAVCLASGLYGNTTTWIAWWYSGIYKNTKAASQPNALVAFREISPTGLLSKEVIHRRIPLTALGQVRIGSIWLNGICETEACFDTHEFTVNFSADGWVLTSFYDAASKGNEPPPYPRNIYPLQYIGDQNWLLRFDLPSGGKLIIPCLEFFTRYYGKSAELRRILATYPWAECKDRLYAPTNEAEEPDKWKVKLRKRLVNSDVVLLAHAKYDSYTEHTIRSIYSQIEAFYDSTNKNPTFIKVSPWFRDFAKLKVKGIWFDEGRSFLALQIIGASDPGGVPILRDRENSNLAEQPAGSDSDLLGSAWAGTPTRKLVKLPEIIDLTGDIEPDSGVSPIEIEDPAFEVLGEPRMVTDIRKERAVSSSGPKVKGADAVAFSSGECHGSGQGIGYASIHARSTMESQGVLRDMWNAMLFMRRQYPHLIQSVEWFTFEDGYRSEKEPKLISLKPFDRKEKVTGTIRNWLYMDAGTLQETRGVLVARLGIRGAYIHILEIQRRPRQKGNGEDTEESFTGMVVIFDDSNQFKTWLRSFLSEVRHIKGVLHRLIGGRTGKAYAFKHSSSNDEDVPCQSALVNALGKIGVLLP